MTESREKDLALIDALSSMLRLVREVAQAAINEDEAQAERVRLMMGRAQYDIIDLYDEMGIPRNISTASVEAREQFEREWSQFKEAENG